MAETIEWLTEKLVAAEAAEKAAETAFQTAKANAEELRITLKWVRQAPGTPNTHPTMSRGGGRFEGMSQTDAAQAVLREAAKPLSLVEVARLMVNGGFRHPKGEKVLKKSLRATVSRYVGEKKIFSRHDRGLYGLLEWKPASVDR